MPTDTSANVRSPPTCWSTHCAHRHNPAVGMMAQHVNPSMLQLRQARRMVHVVADDVLAHRLPVPIAKHERSSKVPAAWSPAVSRWVSGTYRSRPPFGTSV